MADDHRDALTRREADGLYVHQDVYASDQRGFLDRLLRVETKGDRNFRLALTAFVGPAITAFIAWWLTSGGKHP